MITASETSWLSVKGLLILAALVFVGASPRAVHAQTSGAGWQWNKILAAVPAGGDSTNQKVAYNTKVQLAYMFTSSDTIQARVWNGIAWTPLSTTNAPAGRHGFSVVYDASRDRMVLFGGYSVSERYYPGDPFNRTRTYITFQNDTWEWDGKTWASKAPANSPPAPEPEFFLYQDWRSLESPMLYDSHRQRVVIFRKNGCYEWNGSNWSSHATPTAPYGGNNDVMAYDSVRQRFVLFDSYARTWEWDGTNDWIQRNPAFVPEGENNYYMAYDVARQRTVMFGSASSEWVGTNCATYEWDGTNWKNVTPAISPVPSGYAHYWRLFYNTHIQRVEIPDDDTLWIWDGRLWTENWPRRTPSISGPSMAFNSATGRPLLFGATNHWQTATTCEWDGSQWLVRHPAHSPAARLNAPLVYRSRKNQAILFGGGNDAIATSASQNFSDTWVWDGTDWTQMRPATSPHGRQEHAMAYDSERDRVVLFGGFVTGNGYVTSSYFNDTWEWDGTNWNKLTPAQSPPLLRSAVMAYDKRRQRTVLFGGSGPSAKIDAASPTKDTWEWDGTNWKRISGTSFPQANADHMVMVYDDAHQRVTLFERGQESGPRVIWEWDGKTWTKVALANPWYNSLDYCLVYDTLRHNFLLATDSVNSIPCETWNLTFPWSAAREWAGYR